MQDILQLQQVEATIGMRVWTVADINYQFWSVFVKALLWEPEGYLFLAFIACYSVYSGEKIPAKSVCVRQIKKPPGQGIKAFEGFNKTTSVNQC
jgi:hypothetical protein